MKINRLLEVNGEEMELIDCKLTLNFQVPGTAVFVVKSESELSGYVQFYAGFDDEARLYFTGIITASVKMDSKQTRLICREPVYILENRLPLSLRDVTIDELMLQVCKQTDLSIYLGDGDWRSSIMAQVVNYGNGFDLLDWLGDELFIDGFAWYPQADGSIYLGSHSFKKMTFDETFFTQCSVAGGSCMLVPGLRPGVKIGVGHESLKQITRVEISGVSMRLGWRNAA